MFKSKRLLRNLNLKLNVLSNKNLNSKLQLKNSSYLNVKPKANSQPKARTDDRSTPSTMVIDDLLKALNQREAQLNPNKKNFQQKLFFYRDKKNASQLSGKIAAAFHDDNVKMNFLKDPFQLISEEQAMENENTSNKTINNQVEGLDLINKAKNQMEQLNQSFDALINYERSKEPNLSLARFEFINKNAIFNQNIKAYVDVCCQSPKLIDEAFTLVESLMHNNNNTQSAKEDETGAEAAESISSKHPDPEYLSDVEIFNKLMFAYARLGKTTKINLLFKKMSSAIDKEKNIQPNLSPYTAALQSLGHQLTHQKFFDESNDLAKLKLQVERVIWDIKKKNLNLNDIAKTSIYSKEQKMYIKAAIQKVIPGFDFKESFNYSESNDLMKKISSKYTSENDALINEHQKSKMSYPAELVDKEVMMRNFKKQLELESNSMLQVPSIRPLSNKELSQLEKYKAIKDSLLLGFRDSITRTFVKKLSLMEKSEKKNESFLYPFLTILEPSVYVNILMQEAVCLAQNSQYFSPKFNHLTSTLGARIEAKYLQHIMETNGDIEKLKRTYELYLDSRLEQIKSPLMSNHREDWSKITKDFELYRSFEDHSWPHNVRSKIGKFLIEDILMKSCRVYYTLIDNSAVLDLVDQQNQNSLSSSEPNNKKYVSYRSKKKPNGYDLAFHKIYRIHGVFKDPEIKVHPLLNKLFSSSLIFESNKMPMIIPPMPWHSSNQGGYFLSKSNLLRLSSNMKEQRIMVENTPPSNMFPIYDSLNTLSYCPWRINTPILDLLIDIFNSGGNKELEVPEPENRGPKIPKFDKNTIDTWEKKKEYMKLRDNAKKVRSEMHSLWCSELYRLSIANLYRDSIVWFPHTLDFRGRTYPVPPHFNHLGSDIARSLILLGEGKKLGPHGLDMLKIHLINLTGTMKKSTLKERLQYANSILEEIIDSAERPMNGRGWWKKSEEKWQTLACCMEIANVIKTNPTDPQEFVSHFPIHQDGSCNGLQHYAALGRDKDGATSVNLNPSLKPQDVYSNVLDIVESERLKEEKANEIAKILSGVIKRKIIKQTVMTTVYNVTFYGAKLQILRQLEDLNDFPLEKANESSAYIARKTFLSIRQLFSSAREIQDWLSECAYLITRVRNCALKWETPLGLPISQPYFRSLSKNANDVRSFVKTNQPDSMKQRNAFPPNYIHSLDSCHMMLTSLYCQRAGITFISVHDCFWTHAGSVDIMNRICREQFVALHSLPLLENLSNYFLDNYRFSDEEIKNQNNEEIKKLMVAFNKKLAVIPEKGDFDLNKVLESVYFFS